MKTIVTKVTLIVLMWVGGLFSYAAKTDLSVSSIPDSLKNGAFSVIRFDTETFVLNSLKSGISKRSIAITVLDEKGEEDAFFTFYGGSFNIMKNFSAKMYNANGKLLKKYGQSDVMTTEFSSSLATDAKIYLFKCSAPSLPYTVQYDFEAEQNKGILVYGVFNPMQTYLQSVQSRDFRIEFPQYLMPRIKLFNSMPEPTLYQKGGVTSYFWKASNLKAVEVEPLSPPLHDYSPYVIIAPNNFVYDGVPGSISTWNDLGKWSYSLTVGRDLVPEALKAKVLDLTKEAKTDVEKVQILYQYLGETTRYVSIQLGIGGYQPMSVNEVYRTGFGDCKALTNYLKAMLSIVGIQSNYCTIRLDENEKKLWTDFPNFHQMNHVVLMVPLKNEQLWLECTNPKVPFGYVHFGIAGHDVLVCSAEGGKIQQLPDYADSLNLEQHVAHVKLMDDGSANVEMQKSCRVKIYDHFFGFTTLQPSDQIEKLRKEIHLPNVEFGTLKVTENKTALPTLMLDYSWTTPLYGTKTGNRLFLPVNLFRNGYDNLRKSNRFHDVYLKTGYRDADSILLEIPEAYEVEALPPSQSEYTEFGRFTSKVTNTGKYLQIIQIVDVSTGKYKASEFPQFMAFLNKISAAYKGKIILRKKAI